MLNGRDLMRQQGGTIIMYLQLVAYMQPLQLTCLRATTMLDPRYYTVSIDCMNVCSQSLVM